MSSGTGRRRLGLNASAEKMEQAPRKWTWKDWTRAESSRSRSGRIVTLHAEDALDVGARRYHRRVQTRG